jgi:hypothetical protein
MVKQMTTRTTILLAIAIVAIMQVAFVFAAANVDVIKSKLSTSIDKKISSLENFKVKVDSASIDDSDKTLIKSDIDKIIVGLNSFKTELSAATTTQEIVSVIQETNAYIVANKQNITKYVKELSRALNDEVVVKLNQTLVKINAEIDKYQNNCSSQTSQIDAAQSSLNKIASDLNTLNNLIVSGGNQAAILAKAEQIEKEVRSLITQVENIAAACVDERNS